VFKSYPIAATTNNWLHETIVNIIRVIHARLDHNQRVVTTRDKQIHWRRLVPSDIGADKRNTLIRSRGIRDRVLEYARELNRLRLTPQQRLSILDTLEHQNNIIGLLSGISPINTIDLTFPTVNEKVKELFIFCYDKLDDVGIREEQYQVIYDSLLTKYCPFCGFGDMMNMLERSQDQDHYLAKSIYPFASSNIRNLVPMCMKCNQIHKYTTDIIRDDAQTRFNAFDPYTCSETDICIVGSQISQDTIRPTPRWNINFSPASVEAENWDRVFAIRERFERDIFDECFDRWFSGFMQKCSRERTKGLYPRTMSHVEIRSVLEEHHYSLLDDPGSGKDRFKPHIFNMMLNLYDEGNERVISHIRDAVVGDEFS
jgi:hypothetical protein